jgi:predicted component of type VI protein secretion system
VTKLIIYRGEARYSEVSLTGKTMTVGRSAENDVVLEDPGKGVSRAHAELRPEGDKYRLVDLNSQNGIWVSGKRVPSVVLTPGVVAAMGPYRVAIDAVSPLTQPFTPIKDAVPDTGTELFSRLPPMPAEPPAPPLPPPVAVVDGPGALLDSTDPLNALPAAPPPPVKAAPAPAVKPSLTPAAKPSGTATVRTSSSGGSPTKMLAAAVGALVLVAASGFGAYKFVQHRRAAQPVWDATIAANLVNSGQCQEALDKQINVALQANPNDATALALKQKCTAPPPAPAPLTPVVVPPVVDPKVANTQKLDAAEASIAANTCQPALDSINEVLAQDPNDERAKALAAKATACLTPAPPIPAKAAPSGETGVKIAVVDGVEVKQGENRAAYTARVGDLKKRYDDAVTALQDQHYAEAMRGFDSLPPNYRDAAQQRASAQASMRSDANRAYASAQAAEQRQEWTAAVQGYQRARALDPSRDVSADVARVTELRAKAGQTACQNGDAAFLLSHNSEAAKEYQKVIELLPSGDACYVKAKERLARIR